MVGRRRGVSERWPASLTEDEQRAQANACAR